MGDPGTLAPPEMGAQWPADFVWEVIEAERKQDTPCGDLGLWRHFPR